MSRKTPANIRMRKRCQHARSLQNKLRLAEEELLHDNAVKLNPPVKKTWGFPSQFINQPRGYGHTTRATPGVSLPSGSRTRNLQILDPAYKPLRYSGDVIPCICDAAVAYSAAVSRSSRSARATSRSSPSSRHLPPGLGYSVDATSFRLLATAFAGS
jgi:hypothetical protein